MYGLLVFVLIYESVNLLNKQYNYEVINYVCLFRRIQEGGKKAIPSFLNFLGKAPSLQNIIEKRDVKGVKEKREKSGKR